ncbi:double-strand break repair protein AddB [Acidisoma cellulosilytica]|uniref:Double-strand break repair protein AddB n=1 Tax=Acidisoma cellulosilyticum TaxID=2802395 RepID=A0A963Z0F5_9PROT|nr:double-strand break repair protein AddB [Acidisoma cellulosilyticum]MCB8880567.1 double-strand break repair protein AddB [Acidisoma cellulosilyticum]
MKPLGLWSIPSGLSFLDALAQRWLRDHGDAPLAQGLILLPTRRAARALMEAFLRATDGKPLLLPRISAIGAADEVPLALGPAALALPPAMPEAQRLATLSRLIIALEQASGTVSPSLDATWRLARELAALMDEAERAEVPLAQALHASVPEELAAHWQKTLTFLAIATDQWPRILDELQLIDPVARQVRLLHAQAKAWEDKPPDYPVWIAGLTAARPSIAHIARVVAGLPQGAVILQGLDHGMADEVWTSLQPSHPQAGLQRLIAAMGARRDDVQPWDESPQQAPDRSDLLARALLPAEALSAWREAAPLALDGLYRLSPADQQQEAIAIAALLRDTLETPSARAVLITPDRQLAARVAVELRRFGVIADDSAGEALGETPAGTFLRLIARAVADRLAPVPLLALLKHPLTAAGLSLSACRAGARALEMDCLRGPRPAAGLTGLRDALSQSRGGPSPRSVDLLAQIEAALLPLLRLADGYKTQSASDLLRALTTVAEALATTAGDAGAGRLWAGEEGEALASAIAEALPALDTLPDISPSVLPGLLEALLEGKVVRSRRAIRGLEGAKIHPRVSIWGLLEARLQSAEVIVLGGLVEGVWPPAPDPGPWLSRRMRAEAGLPSPEEEIGQAAHDFLTGACAAPTVILSAPLRVGGAPAVPARWLKRLEAMLAGQSIRLPAHPALTWAQALDQPGAAPQPARPPAPKPAVALRPRSLSITEIETWLADPYAIYARHVLQLKELDPLDQATDAADYGRLVHAGVQHFLTEAGAEWRADSPHRLRIAMDRALSEARLRPALANWWRPRLQRIADWIAEVETARRAGLSLTKIGTEVSGRWALSGPAGPFTLKGRADRIERRADGSLTLIDYKTGTVPTEKRVREGHAPQLPLEAAMAASGAFGEDYTGPTVEMSYWRLRGGAEPGAVITPIESAIELEDLAKQSADSLRALIAAFDDAAKPYLARPHPGRAARDSAYGRLARLAEWAGGGDEG